MLAAEVAAQQLLELAAFGLVLGALVVPEVEMTADGA